MSNTAKDSWSRWHTVGLLVVVVTIVLVGSSTVKLTPESDASARLHWYGLMVLLLLFMIIAGQGISGRLAGLLIDERNKMSLSRLQLVLWTVVILSAYLTVVLARIPNEGLGALSVAIPEKIWWLLGISTASMVGSPLVLSNKKQQKVSKTERETSVQLLAEEVPAEEKPEKGDAVWAVGAVVVYASPKQARFADLFRGDETGNATSLDLGKVQMFFFTIVVVLAYAFVLAAEFPALVLGATAEFPALDEGMIALLGISHAGYLSNKAVPHSASASAEVSLPGATVEGEDHDPQPKA